MPREGSKQPASRNQKSASLAPRLAVQMQKPVGLRRQLR